MENIPHGSRFGSNLSILAIFVFLFGVFLLYNEQYLMGGIISIISLIVAFEPTGVEIDYKKKQIREYEHLLLIKTGKWKDLKNYNQVCIKRDKEMKSIGVIGAVQSYTHDSFDVLLSSKNPDIKDFLLKPFGNHKDARKFLLKYSEKLGLPDYDAIYNIKKKNLARRRETIRR